MDGSTDGGGFTGAPPVSSFGCYKGVMLCNRPPDDVAKAHPGEPSNQPPFKSTISATARDQVGLPPAKDGRKIEPSKDKDVKTRGPSAALRRHCQWIKELQEQVKEDQLHMEQSAQAQEQRKQRLQESYKKQRDAIRQIKAERGRENLEPHEIEAVIRPRAAQNSNAGKQKPMWAMTEAEKEDFEDEEAEDLIRFAEDLDFDKYICDLEFRQGLQAVRDRAKKIQREQDAFKDSIIREFNGPDEEEDDEDRSSSPGGPAGATGPGRPGEGRRTHEGGPGSQPDWDTSTNAGDERSEASHALRSAAGRLLEANPGLRAVHSKASVQRLLERASQPGSGPPTEA